MRVRRRVLIDCKAKPIWKCLTDPELLPLWISNFEGEEIPEGTRPGVGATTTIRMRENGMIRRYKSVVTEWRPESRLGLAISGGALAAGMEMLVTYELNRGEDTGTQLDYEIDFPLPGIVYKVMAPLIWLGCVTSSKKDLAKLAELAPTIT